MLRWFLKEPSYNLTFTTLHIRTAWFLEKLKVGKKITLDQYPIIKEGRMVRSPLYLMLGFWYSGGELFLFSVDEPD